LGVTEITLTFVTKDRVGIRQFQAFERFVFTIGNALFDGYALAVVSVVNFLCQAGADLQLWIDVLAGFRHSGGGFAAVTFVTFQRVS
jgi:hypothetical protein